MEAASVNQYITIASTGVTGYAAWKANADGMVAADPPPPHMPLVKEFWAGRSNEPNSFKPGIRVCHLFDTAKQQEDFMKLFAAGGPLGAMLDADPVMTQPLAEWQWNTFNVKVVTSKKGVAATDPVVEDGQVLGIYAHAVADTEGWCKAFADSADTMPPEFTAGLVRSYGGPMVGEGNAWKSADGKAMVMVVHVFASLDAKAGFDAMFDATAGMFKDMADKGAVIAPFLADQCAPVWQIANKHYVAPDAEGKE